MQVISQNAYEYTVQLLFKFIGIKDNYEKVKTVFSDDEGWLKVEFSENREVVFHLMSEKEITKLLQGDLPLRRVESFDKKIVVPMYLKNNNDAFAIINNTQLIINADIITLSFIMLSRYEEIIVEEKDKLNRFEYKNSLASKYNFIDIPIVDEYAMLLKKWLMTFIPTLEFCDLEGKIIPTHDIDAIRRFGNIFQSVKTIIGGDILIRKSLKLALESIKQYRVCMFDYKNDPFIIDIEQLVGISKLYGLSSEFYFMGSSNRNKYVKYDIFMPEVKYCMNVIKNADMSVGMHGGFDSYDNESIFKQEKENIESVFGESLSSQRQHFLRFDINKTIQIWQNCGIQNDSTLGYAEREGFRCGTCHSYSLYDFKNDCKSSIEEHPLIVMEETIFKYRRQNIETALDNIQKLYERSKDVNGDFVILWHNDTVSRDYKIRFLEVYCKFIERNS